MSNKQPYLIGLRPLIIILLVLGVFFRFSNLDKKVYWIDEVHTSVRIAGYGKQEFVELVSKGQIIGIEDLQKYQRLTPERGLGDAIKALAGNAEHSPLYYLTARFWTSALGSSVAAIRSWSAVISLVAFPCIYWLGLELFASPLVAWMAVGLIAVSPFHVLYAQEARQYSLWAVTILLSSATLLWTIRDKTEKIPVSKWGIYASTIALGLYAHLLFALTLLGHGIYLVALDGWRNHQSKSRLLPYLGASLAGTIAFLPWLLLFVNDSDGIGGWVARKTTILTLIQRWSINLASIFFDIQVSYSERLFDIESVQDKIQLGFGNP
ncbi:MAG TPA: glycosyltransferase family 39 protein, partial [Coleofasciculaceae cyanobacterium]